MNCKLFFHLAFTLVTRAKYEEPREMSARKLAFALVTRTKYEEPRTKASMQADFHIGYSCKI